MSNYYGRESVAQADSQYYGAPQQSYGGYDNNYSTYQPPQDDSYRQEMSVTRYDDEEARYRGGGRYEDRYEDERPYSRGSARGREYDDDRRRGSRSHSRASRRGSRGISVDRDREEFYESERGGPRKDHHKGKELGAGALGAAIGGFAGHEFGHNKMATTIGALAGAWGGYELEKRHEKKKERRDSQQIVEYSDNNYSRRSLSRGSRSRSRSRRRSEYDDDEYQRRYERYN